jgi:hypothetical protein
MLTNETKVNKSNNLFFLFLGSVIILGSIILLVATKWGLGISDDSYYYIYPTQDYLNGMRFNPSLHYPPFLSLLLLIPGLIRVNLLDACHWMNACLFGINIAIISYLMWIIRRSHPLAVLTAVGFFSLGFFFELHAWVMSEALFIFLTLCGFLFLIIWLDSRRPLWLIISGLLWGLSTTTRYIGITGLIAGSILLLVFIKPRSFINLVWFVSSGLVPIVGMVMLSVSQSGGISDRNFDYYPISYGNLLAGVRSMVETIIPGRFVAGYESIWLIILLVCIIFSGLLLFARSTQFANRVNRAKYSRVISITFYLYIAVYLFILINSRVFFDPLIPFDARMLGPILIVSIMLFLLLVGDIWPRIHVMCKWAFFLVIVMLLVVNGIRTIKIMHSYYEQGRGYSSARDHISETYAYLRSYPDIQIYSNAPAALYFWIGRHTLALTGSEGLSEMKKHIARDGGLVVIFDSIPLELYNLDREQVIEGLTVLITLSESTIYQTLPID